MKKSGFLLLFVLFLLILACKSPPPPAGAAGEPETAGSTGLSEGEGDAGLAETADAAELSALDDGPDTSAAPDVSGVPGEEPGDSPAGNLAEPEPELAETGAGPLAPEDEAPPALPEPDAAALFSPPEPEPPAASPPMGPAAAVTESPPPQIPPAPPPPSGLRPAEETRPPRLRPAEEDASAGIAREPEPRPVQPPPAVPEPEIRPLAPPPAVPEGDMVFSRIVRATVGQLVEIPFRGTGWVYLGELGARRGIAYDSRRLDPEGQSFVFRAEAAGTYALKFYKQDFIRDYILNDYVQVIIGEAPETSATGWFNPPLDRGRVSAERWPSALEEAEALARGRSGAAAGSVPPAEGSVPGAGSASAAEPPAGAPPAGAGTPPVARPAVSDEGIVPVRPPAAAPVLPGPSAGTEDWPALPEETPPAGYLQKAQEEFNAGRVAGALAVLDQFRARFPAGSDEAWWLYGQFYEANSPSRDIRTALDYYRRLVREYPQSRRYNDARRRIAYLERYYINIQ